MQFKSVFCSNLLEHVVERNAICRTLLSIIPSGGFLFISVPFSFPYHPDPIDTRFRPTVEELVALFPGTHLVHSAVVVGETFLKLRSRNLITFALTLTRCLMPFYKPVGWWRNRGYLPWFFRRVSATCVVLRKG
jgi:2-polyprenyl-3-methyl-5-hydroxy-6-metoxy-1,4-benzoquinol methylase